MATDRKPAIGIIGVGRLGTVVAKLALRAGYTVRIINSKSPETLLLIISVLLPGAIAAPVEDVIRRSEVIVLAIPLHKYRALTPELFRNKIVIDAMNYWPSTEGNISEFEDAASSSEYIQSYLSGAKVVKALSHVAYHELEEHSLLLGNPKRRALALAGNDKDAKAAVGKFISDIGFDPVDIGELANGKKFQPDTKLFNIRYSADEMRKVSG